MNDEISGLPADQHNFGTDHGYSPVAHRVALVDFDSTMVPWGPLMEPKDLTPGTAEAIARLQDSGYRIVVFTSRMSRKWAASVVGCHCPKKVEPFIAKQREFVLDTLRRGGIEGVTEVSAEKVPAEFYIDDKAYRFEGDWELILDQILG